MDNLAIEETVTSRNREPGVGDQSENAEEVDIPRSEDQRKLPFRLELAAALGYAGSTSLRNLRFLDSGQFVYTIGSVAVVGDENDPWQRFFTAHTDEISCLAIHPDGIKVVTADVGVEPTVIVWDSDTMKVLTRIVATSDDVQEGQQCIGMTALFGSINSLPHRSALTRE
eukprot:3691627-Rhodomonas_salina.1